MGSEYDPLFTGDASERGEDLEAVRELFAAAGRPYLSSPWSWAAWSVILPVAALATERAAPQGPLAVLSLWAGAVIVGGVIEIAVARRGRTARTRLTTWILRTQGNLSLVAVVLSGLLVALGEAWALPGVWLLLLGHSFATLGALTFAPLRRAGWIYLIGGILALAPQARPLWTLAAATACANLWVAWHLARAARRVSSRGTGRSPAR